MIIYIVGNPLVKADNLPHKLLPQLKSHFPSVKFEEIDPNEDFVPEENSLIIDTVVGIDKVILFETLDDFTLSKKISPHDYDLGLHLKLLQKLGKFGKVRILGLPQRKDEKNYRRLIEIISNSLLKSE